MKPLLITNLTPQYFVSNNNNEEYVHVHADINLC